MKIDLQETIEFLKLKPEPSIDNKNSIKLLIKLPNGENIQRFLKTDNLNFQTLIHFIRSSVPTQTKTALEVVEQALDSSESRGSRPNALKSLILALKFSRLYPVVVLTQVLYALEKEKAAGRAKFNEFLLSSLDPNNPIQIELKDGSILNSMVAKPNMIGVVLVSNGTIPEPDLSSFISNTESKINSTGGFI
ncbi:hypothetical protein ACTFIV_010392 [Dictyostelium citrinum]